MVAILVHFNRLSFVEKGFIGLVRCVCVCACVGGWGIQRERVFSGVGISPIRATKINELEVKEYTVPKYNMHNESF